MKFLDQVLGLLKPSASESPGPTHDYWYSPVGGSSASGVNITPDSAMRVAAVYACVRVLSQGGAALPCHIYRRMPGGGKERASDHPLYDLLRFQPNPETTAMEFWESMIGICALRGVARAEIVPGPRGAVDQLIVLHPDYLTVRRLPNGRRVFDYHPPGEKRRVLLREEIFELKGLSLNGKDCLSPIAYMREAVGLAMAAEAYGARFFKNGAKPSGVLEHPGQLSLEARENLKRSWMLAQGGANQNSIAVLAEGMKYNTISLTHEDAQFIEIRKYQVTDIARMFGVQPHKIADMERSTFNNIEHQDIEFVVHTLRPWLVRIEQSIYRDLIIDKRNYYAEFLVDSLMRGDSKARGNYYVQMLQNGVFNRNEVREMENRNPVPGGDEFMTPLNMQKGSQNRQKDQNQNGKSGHLKDATVDDLGTSTGEAGNP